MEIIPGGCPPVNPVREPPNLLAVTNAVALDDGLGKANLVTNWRSHGCGRAGTSIGG